MSSGHALTCMRTTIRLSDDLLRKAKKLAENQNRKKTRPSIPLLDRVGARST